MSFVVAGDVRKWTEDITAAMKTDLWYTETIVESDRWVRIKLAKYPPLLVEIVPGPVQDFTHALAEAAGVEASLRRARSEEGESAESSDRKMWEGIRDELLRELLGGDLGIGPGALLMTSNAQRANMYPVFGYGEWSERILSTMLPASQAGYHEHREDLP